MRRTPAPWTAKKRTDGLFNIYHAAGVQDVCLCAREPDARLLVKAPEMLNLIEMLARGNTEYDTLSEIASKLLVEIGD